MLIRSATNHDAEAIRRVVFGVLTEYGLTAEHRGVDVDLDDIEANYFARGGLFEVMANEAGHMVGTVGLYARDDKVCELRKMYLLPALRGQGLGRQLLDRMLGEARRRGFTRMELETSSKLIEAIALYRRYGFAPFTSPHLAGRCDGAYYLNLQQS